MISAIPYRTFPSFHLGPVRIQTFGVFVAAGIAVGIWVFSRYARSRGLDADALSRLAFWIVALGLVGSRLLFVFTHVGGFVDRPLAVFAVWEGGLQFSGAFLVSAGVIVWWLRRHPEVRGRRVVDGIVLGLAPGLLIGRFGCAAVGEHLGEPTTFFIGWEYLGGPTREGLFAPGTVIHNTAIYEIVLLVPLALLLWWLARRRVPDGWVTVAFLLWYGVQRFATDLLRAYDRRVFGLTGAQYLCIAMVLAGLAMAVRLGRRGRHVRRAPAAA
ncbi:MAG: prolipoprotein diacylglyceryl transferase [Actinomycetota bacterium]|nr:MAG: prolipoprotein diacylglyceryl transferase [Actinomycetota bacterium]